MHRSVIMQLVKEAYLEGLSVSDESYDDMVDEIGYCNDINSRIFEQSDFKLDMENKLDRILGNENE